MTIEEGDITARIDPEVSEVSGPRPLTGPEDEDGWREIYSVGTWDCAFTEFRPMEDVPFHLRGL